MLRSCKKPPHLSDSYYNKPTCFRDSRYSIDYWKSYNLKLKHQNAVNNLQVAHALSKTVLAKHHLLKAASVFEQFIHSISSWNTENCLIPFEKQYKYTSEKEKKSRVCQSYRLILL